MIGDSARKEEAGAQRKKDDSITFDTSDYKYAGYMRKLKEKIESIWVYPPEAQAKGLYGDRDNTLYDPQETGSSGLWSLCAPQVTECLMMLRLRP